MAEIADLAAKGQLTVTITETFPMERIVEAHTLSEGGHVRGKLVISLCSRLGDYPFAGVDWRLAVSKSSTTTGGRH